MLKNGQIAIHRPLLIAESGPRTEPEQHTANYRYLRQKLLLLRTPNIKRTNYPL